MKKLSFILFLVFMLIYPASRVIAQDTVSTEGIEFSDAASPAPVANKTVLKKVVSSKIKNQAQIISAGNAKSTSLWAIFIAGLLGGFAALLMPCIFPMLPMTVSFFTKGSSEKGKGVAKAMLYGISIIVIYVVLGLAITVCFGADALNSLSTNGVFNFAFFLLIVAFAASFLGAFEITLPSSWVNKMDNQSERKGFAGIFFMAATLALVSFSCTGPIIGTLLVQAATTGALLGPAIGMFGFALALAIPFTLFALFPGWMSALPKSGGWLNSVKITLGFLELAFALKFLSNVDLAYHWHLFDREIFLVLWIVIFALLGFYLLGKLTLNHDSPLSYVSVPRLFLAIIVLAFTMYMVPGLWGAPLKSISSFLPPMSTQDFDLSATNSGIAYAPDAADNKPHKYASLFDKPRRFNPFFDYDEALAYAKKVNKPIMIDFTGHACVNCRKMEANVWPDKEVSERINREYVLVQLYVDDKTDLATDEQSTTPEGRTIKTIGNKWSYLQTSKFQANSQPFYVLLDPRTEQPLVTPQGADYDPAEFAEYLKRGLKSFAAK
jgi:thiol:disulfide interchange protein